MAARMFHGIRARSANEALIIAAANSKLDVIRALLDEGVDIDATAPGSELNALATAASLRCVQSVELLLDRGADVDKLSEDEMTPLMLACAPGDVKGSLIALRLMEAGANVKYVRKSDEMTALKFAAEKCKPDVIRAMIDRGASVDGPPKTSQTALMIAARAGNVENLKVLVQNGADIHRKCKLRWAENRTALGLAELEKRKKAAKYLASLE